MIKKMLPLLLVLAAILFFPATDDKAEAAPFRGDMGKDIANKMSGELGLTKEQKDSFLSNIKKTEEEAKKINKENRATMEKIEVEMKKTSPDAGFIEKRLDEIGRNMTRIQLMRMKNILDLKKDLTPAQSKKFEELQEKRIKKMKEMKKDGARGFHGCKPCSSSAFM